MQVTREEHQRRSGANMFTNGAELQKTTIKTEGRR